MQNLRIRKSWSCVHSFNSLLLFALPDIGIKTNVDNQTDQQQSDLNLYAKSKFSLCGSNSDQ